MSNYRPAHLDSVAAKLRSDPHIKLLSPLNQKTPKGEKHGYLEAILYLAPHTLGGGHTLCAHSTDACRAGCLYTAGRGKTARVVNARLRRTREYLTDRPKFLTDLVAELEYMSRVADRHELKLAIRLNGTSDVLWEREEVEGRSIFDLFPQATFFDYTRTPAQHRRVPANWHLTFSLADDPLSFALDHLAAGRNVAAVVTERERASHPDWFMLGDEVVGVVDGELHDLRFLDEAPALVLLKPKGRLARGGPMVRVDLVRSLYLAGRAAA